jgi:hypothetical protein
MERTDRADDKRGREIGREHHMHQAIGKRGIENHFQPVRSDQLPGIVDGVTRRREALVPVEPSAHLGMFVGGLVVEDHMHGFASRDLGFDGVEEANELLMAVALHIAADRGPVEYV